MFNFMNKWFDKITTKVVEQEREKIQKEYDDKLSIFSDKYKKEADDKIKAIEDKYKQETAVTVVPPTETLVPLTDRLKDGNSSYGDFGNLLEELTNVTDKSEMDEKLLDEMMEMGSLMVSIENIEKELFTIQGVEGSDDEVVRLQTEMAYAMKRIEELSGISKEGKFIYYAPVDDKDEVQWVPYVFDNKDSFVYYLLGRKLSEDPLLNIFMKMIISVSEDIDPSAVTEDSYANKIFSMAKDGSIPLLFEHTDFSMSSTRITGVLPDGSRLEDVSSEEAFEIISETTNSMSHGNIEESIENGTIEMRLDVMSNLLNVTCPYCGVPHNFKDVEDIPLKTQHCTMCNNVLIQYTRE